MELKVGDRVETIRSIGIDDIIPIGTKGTIKEVNLNDYDVQFDNQPKGRIWWADDNDLKKESKDLNKVIDMPKSKSSKTVKENVEYLLGKYPNLRNNDKELELKYWIEIDGCNTTSIEDFMHDFITTSTPPVTIVRARRLIQEEGNYLPTDPDVLTKRHQKELAMKLALKNRQVV